MCLLLVNVFVFVKGRSFKVGFRQQVGGFDVIGLDHYTNLPALVQMVQNWSIPNATTLEETKKVFT